MPDKPKSLPHPGPHRKKYRGGGKKGRKSGTPSTRSSSPPPPSISPRARKKMDSYKRLGRFTVRNK